MLIKLSYSVNGTRLGELVTGVFLTERGEVMIEAQGRRPRLEWSAAERMISVDSGVEARGVEITCDGPLALVGPEGHLYETSGAGYKLEIVSEQLRLLAPNGSESARYLASRGSWYVSGSKLSELRLMPATTGDTQALTIVQPGPRHRYSPLAERLALGGEQQIPAASDATFNP